ncbi:MAG: DUF2854 domain-containing protein [Synechococcales cyanobacterium K44_A2020_017]|uniref:DUF2854 domain-containing protein n=1 Tax=Leptolyngbya sp. CCY15150 TaxID=2767772 RepID=UPI00195004A4|nr:DUF2854 domain-containing protein [Leptolyngbya sp. CCY15150]MBF2089983.1 DUF2854 domain-containing protein [Synechococcales cyanobacterium K32_A2020_035]MBF2094227.1 DUF2854 domain-containing protein [Synechococcales cyanobacterium K44_A2020_017]
MLGKTSLGSIGLVIGGILSVIGFTAYFFSDNATLNLVGFFYGIPILLGGFALKAAELKPAPFAEPTTPQVLQLREQKATATQNQIRKDVTRYRYGQEVHLDTSLERLDLCPSDEERPVLIGVREADVEGEYALVLQFLSPLISLELWLERREKIERFFGPGIRVEVTQTQDEYVEVSLITTASTAPLSSAA